MTEPVAAAAAIELTTLTDGGQRAAEVARGIAAFLAGAQKTLDIAVYDVRFETDAGGLVLASLLAAAQRSVGIRLLYNVAHPGPIAVPPPPETAPEAIERLPIPTRGIAGIPDLMHHKFVVRDGSAVWTGSTNWTDDSWTRQENVIAVLRSPEIAYAYTLAFGQLWDSGKVEDSGEVDPRPETLDGARVRAWFCPEHGEALSHRVAKHIGKATKRIRIASPVLTSGPILGTLVEVVNEGRCPVAGIVDDTQVDQVFEQWRTNGVSDWKIPLLHRVLDGGDFSGKRLSRGRLSRCTTSCTRRSSSRTIRRSSAASTSPAPASGTPRTSLRSEIRRSPPALPTTSTGSVPATRARPRPASRLRKRREDDRRGRAPRRPVVHGLDVVPIRVEHVGAVVARVVVALAGSAVVLPARGDRGSVEALHGLLVLGREREVEFLGRRPVGAHVQLVRPEGVLAALDLQAECAERRLVEASAPLEVAHAQMDVVEEAAAVVLHGADYATTP